MLIVIEAVGQKHIACKVPNLLSLTFNKTLTIIISKVIH
jgi:hypothetical protein